MDIEREVVDAAARIRGYVRETPVERSHQLSRLGGCRAFLKLENYQVTGSFKVRGAMNRILAMSEAERDRGFVAASSGNHGVALAYVQEALGCSGLVVVPNDASPAKVEAIRAHGAEVKQYGDDCLVSEEWARAEAARRGVPYVSPYNDPLIVAGQGTVGLELAEQMEAVDTVYVAVGGGGLVSGIAGLLKRRQPDVEVVGCWPRNSAVMYESLRAGRIVEMESLPTLSDGTAGGVEEGSITFDLCQRLIDRSILVGEEEIAVGMRLVAEHHHMMVEGAAGVAVAAFLSDMENVKGKNVVIVLCGANISLDVLRRVIA